MSADLTTRYLGFELAHPIIPSASPLTGSLGTLHKLEEAGAPAVVLPSLFEEQIVHEAAELAHLVESLAGSFVESPAGYFPELDTYNTGPDAYLRLVEDAKRELRIPIIGSLNGSTRGGWVHYARLIEDAGADALELNIYVVAANPMFSASDMETQYLELIEAVKEKIKIPLAVKVSPYFSAFANMAKQMVDAGADSLVMFNRFYQPDFDIEEMGVTPNLELSTPHDLRLPLRWIAILFGRIKTQFAATSGVHSAEDVVKLLLAGADVTMTTASLLKYGPGHMTDLVCDLERWLDENEYSSVSQLRGSLSQVNAPDPTAFERHNYMKALTTFRTPSVA